MGQTSKDASERQLSVGEVARQAVEDKFAKEKDLNQRKQAVESTLKHRKILKGKIDYKALINEGRKY